MAANAEIFFEHDRWGRNLTWSLGLHIAIAGAIVLYAVVVPGSHGEGWGAGGGGDAMGVTLVSTVPLPANPVKTENVLANDSKGITQSLPKPEPVEEKLPDAIPIPDKVPKTSATQQKAKPPAAEESDNVVPFGQGGPVSGPYGSFSANGAKGGFGFTGGGGDFGSRYSWYVRVVQQKVSENWLKYEVDPSISTAQRVYITFDVMRDGHPANVQVEQSSGVPSLDQSATRAIQRIDTFGPLPSDYAANKVSVEFWFDYKR
jgi:periplasmic protein TonB